MPWAGAGEGGVGGVWMASHREERLFFGLWGVWGGGGRWGVYREETFSGWLSAILIWVPFEDANMYEGICVIILTIIARLDGRVHSLQPDNASGGINIRRSSGALSVIARTCGPT